MISFPDTSETLPAPEDHDWWVFGQVGTQSIPALFCVCKITNGCGVVWDPTDEELEAAAGLEDWKFKITDPGRVEITKEECPENE